MVKEKNSASPIPKKKQTIQKQNTQSPALSCRSYGPTSYSKKMNNVSSRLYQNTKSVDSKKRVKIEETSAYKNRSMTPTKNLKFPRAQTEKEWKIVPKVSRRPLLDAVATNDTSNIDKTCMGKKIAVRNSDRGVIPPIKSLKRLTRESSISANSRQKVTIDHSRPKSSTKKSLPRIVPESSKKVSQNKSEIANKKTSNKKLSQEKRAHSNNF